MKGGRSSRGGGFSVMAARRAKGLSRARKIFIPAVNYALRRLPASLLYAYSVMIPSMGRPSKSPQPAYGRHLAELRKAAGFSQQHLAQTLSVRQSTIASWEQSPNPPKGEVLPALAAALKVSLDTLLGVRTAPKAARHRGPASQFEHIIEKVSQLPRRRQQRITKTLEALIAQEAAEAAADS